MIQSRNDRISANIFWIISLSTILAVFFSTTVNYYDADAKGSLLVSKAIVEKGTIKLNKLEANNLTEKYGYRVKSRGENIYNYFPLGNQLLAIPVVLAAELIGVNAQEKEEDLQWIMTLITSILIFYLVHDISRRFLDEINSAFFSIVFILGTGLSSTLFTAYWSHNASVTLSLFIIKLIIDSRRNGQLILWPLIAASLFLCYLSRPTTSIMMVISLCLMIYSFKKQSFKPILTLIVMLIGFIAFSFHEFGQPLPDYYMQSLGGEYLMVSLPGNSISPSRGIIVFSPFIPLLIMFFSATNNVSDRLSLMAYGVIWPLIHFLVISSYETWHGGWSFGPRLITDVLPGLLLISLNAWPDLRKFNTREPRFFFLVLSILLAIFINSWQGLHNKSTKEWNAITGFEYDPALVFDWNYPQFAANQNRNLEATIKYRLTEKKSIQPGINLMLKDKDIGFVSISDDGWTTGKSAFIYFINETHRSEYKCQITFDGQSFGKQSIEVKLNDHPIFQSDSTETDKISTSKYFACNRLVYGLNKIEFITPDSRTPKNGDSRELGIRLNRVILN